MKHKYAELDIYEDFINGSLEPSKMNGSHLLFISKYLKEELAECQDMILGKFKKQGKKYELVEKLKISSAHPLASDYYTHYQIRFPNIENEIIPEPILKQLEVKHREDIQPVLLKKLHNITHIGISFPSNWNDLEDNRLKYCYFNHQLKEIARKTKSDLRADVFNSSEAQSTELIHGIQTLLLSYLNDLVIKFKLKESDLIIKVKSEYSDKDCASLIHHSIVDILNFIYTHFPDKMDQKQIVPFCANVATQPEFVSTSKRILKMLDTIDIHEKLLETISDQIEKVLNLNLQSAITYKELNYFKKFVISFIRLLEKNYDNSKVEEEINQFLIGFNFNDHAYFGHLVNIFHQQIIECESIEDMEVYLLTKQKEFNQTVHLTRERLMPERDDIINSLNDWIISETEYVSQMINKKYTIKKETISNATRLTSKVSLAELSLLFKLLNDKNYIESKSKNELSRWIVQSFKNEKGEPFSYQNIKNNMYNVMPKSKERVKSINFTLINELNSI